MDFNGILVSLTTKTFRRNQVKKTCAKFDYRSLKEGDYKGYCWIVVGMTALNHGIKVREAALKTKVTGDFNGLEIIIRSDLSWEMKLFIMVHLFGHTVQFNHSPALREIGMKRWTRQELKEEKNIKTICDYERMAARYGLWLLHMSGIDFLDQWASDWSNGDLKYLLMLYTTGAKYELTGRFLKQYKEEYIKFGSKLIKPLRVPKFTPQEWPSRFSF